MKRALIIGGLIVAVVVVAGLVRGDEIDRFLDDRHNGEYAAEFRDGFMDSCVADANDGLAVWLNSPNAQTRRAAEQISLSTIQRYCGCAYDIALPRFTEADLRAAADDRITDHTRLVQDEAVDRCVYIIEATLR